MNSKISCFSQAKILFGGNIAEYGGAMYVNDYTTSSTCASRSYTIYSRQTECFIQRQYNEMDHSIHTRFIRFVHNTATVAGPILFGGLLDRCSVIPYLDLNIRHVIRVEGGGARPIQGASFLKQIAYMNNLNQVSSDPVRVCFCIVQQHNCNYSPPPFNVKKGAPFNMSLVAVDQVDHPVNATIHTSLGGGLKEGQQLQQVFRECTNLTFNVYSYSTSEKLILHAEGPCKDTGISKSSVIVNFLPCTCPVGFQQSNKEGASCKCDCDPEVHHYVTQCSAPILTKESNIWITYVNSTMTKHGGYLIHPNCPYDYCLSSAHINLNVLDGSDAQCAFHRSGLLCGACRPGFSLSIGSSHCIECPQHNQILIAVLFVLLTVIAGIAVVAVVLSINMTVAFGTLNGIIFYVNTVASGSNTFLTFSAPNLLTVFIKGLNFQMVLDGCFYKTMDTYAITWLGLIFSAYLIAIVIMCILVSERSSKFAQLIGKGNSVATLATLILLSYAKLIGTTIHIFSFAILKYPDGSREIVWRPDANVKYLKGKHIPLFLTAIVSVTAGLAYTILLFSWQWLLQAPNKKIFEWVRNTKLNSFMDAYHAPYRLRYRYWTGFLLLVRVVLYITSAVNVSGDPRHNLLDIGLIVAFLLLLKAYLGDTIYKNKVLDCFESTCYFNILFFTLATYYSLGYISYQKAAAYVSCTITMVMFIIVLSYHGFTYIMEY